MSKWVCWSKHLLCRTTHLLKRTKILIIVILSTAWTRLKSKRMRKKSQNRGWSHLTLLWASTKLALNSRCCMRTCNHSSRSSSRRKKLENGRIGLLTFSVQRSSESTNEHRKCTVNGPPSIWNVPSVQKRAKHNVDLTALVVNGAPVLSVAG